MPTPQNVRYTVHANGETVVWGPKTFEENKEKLFTDFPDATVVQMNQDWQNGEQDESSSYVIHSDGGDVVWGPKTFAANKDKLLQDFPNAQIYRAKNVNYWGDKLGEIYGRMESLENELKNLPAESSGAELRNMAEEDLVAEAQRVSQQKPGLDRRREIKQELDQLYRMREENPAWNRFWEVSRTEIDEDNARIDAKQQKLYSDNPDAYEAYKKATMLGARSGPMAGFAAVSAWESDPAFNSAKESYDAARLMLRDAKNIANAPSRYDNKGGAMSDFWQGIVDGAPEAWSVSGLMRAGLDMHLVDAIKEIQAHEGKDADIRKLVQQEWFDDLGYLNGGEKELVKAFVKRAELEAMKSDTTSRSYQAGQSTIESAGFMLDFLALGGFGDMAGTAATRAMGLSVEAAGRNTLKKIGVEALSGSVKALAMTPLMPSSYANFVDGILQMDDAGRVDLSGKKMLQQAGDIIIENISETIGSKPLDLIGIPLQKVKFPDWAKALHNSSVISGLRKAGYNGFFEEMVEEWTGNALRVVTGVDKDALKNFATVDQQLITAGAFAPMSLMGLPVSMARFRAASKQMSAKEKALGAIMGKLEGMPSKLDVSDLNNPEELGEYMGDIYQQMVRNGAAPAEAYKAVMEYTSAVARYKYMSGAMEYDKDMERSTRLTSMDAAMGTSSWHHFGKNDASFVRTITDSDGNVRFVTGEQNGELMLIDRQGVISFLPADALESGIEDGTLTDSGEQLLFDYLDRESENERAEIDQQQRRQYSNRAMAELAQRALPGMQLPLGSEENLEIGTILDVKGGLFYVGKQDGSTTILTAADVASKLGISLTTESEENRTEREAEQEVRFQDKRTLGNYYNGKTFTWNDGKQYTLVAVTRGKDSLFTVNVRDESGKALAIDMNEEEFDSMLQNWIESPMSGVAPGATLEVEFIDGSTAKYEFVREENQEGEVVVIGRRSDGEEVELTPDMITNYAELTGGKEEAGRGVAPGAAPAAKQPQTNFFDDPIANSLGIGEDFVYVTEDGRRVVNSTELWNKNPELWAKWNDQNPARITGTLDFLDSKVKTLDNQVSKKQKELDTANKNGADQGRLEELQKQLSDLSSRQNQIHSLYDSYAAAEQRRQEEARRAAEEDELVKKIFPNLTITDPVLRHEIALAYPSLERIQKMEGLSVIQELGEAISREAEGESLTPTEATMRMFSEAAKTPGLLASMMEQYVEVAESVNADTVAEKQDILREILGENNIILEDNGSIRSDQSGVPADAEVRPASAEQAAVGQTVDAAGERNLASVQGEGDHRSIEQARRQAVIDNAQQRLDDWNARMQSAATEEERQALLQEKVGILQEMVDGIGIDATVTTDMDLDGQYLNDGATQEEIEYVRNGIEGAKQNGERPRAFFSAETGRSYILADFVTTAIDGVTSAVHEDKHLENRSTGAVQESLNTGVTTLEMGNAVFNLTRSHAYDNAGRDELADEVLANAAELAEMYGVDAVSQKLRDAGITNEKFINFVQTNIENGRSRSNRRDQGSVRNPLQHSNEQGSGRQNGRNSRRGPAEVEGGRDGTAEGSAQENRGGEEESGLDTPDENGVTPAQTREITAAAGGQMENGPATRFSTTAIVEGAGMQAIGVTDSGDVMFVGPDGKKFTGKDTVTADYLKNLPNTVMGYMMADARRLGNINENQEAIIWQRYADMLNAFLQKGLAENGGIENLAANWQWVAETVYKTVAPNSDDQYSYSLDITRVCKKNEAVIKTIAETQRRLGYGVTPGQIMDIYLASEREGYQVPCPVCYVFSRYIRNGQYATIMINGQRKYGSRLKDPRTMTEAEKKEAINYWKEELAKQQENNERNEKAITRAKDDIQKTLDKIDKLGMRLLAGKPEGEKAERIIQEIVALDARYRKALQVVSQAGLDGWITNFAIHKVKGKWELYDDSFQGFPEEMALDLRETATVLREYPAIQRYRNSRGAAAGKEITFEANNDIGEVPMMLGVSKSALKTAPNYYKLAAEAKSEKKRESLLKKASARFKNASLYARQQSLRGGQRMWSWSDNIERLSPDVFVNLMQMEMLGGALQSYSKQLEGINLVARMGGYVNGSLMGKGIGYRELSESDVERDGDRLYLKGGDMTMSDGSTLRTPVYERDGKYYTLEFDDVVGVDPFGKNEGGKRYKGLFDLNRTLDKAGNILVGMDDIHVRTAMADDRIFFIIPWHSSGGSVHILKQMLTYLGVDVENFKPDDYTDVQEEKRPETISEFLTAFWEAHKNEQDFRVGIEGGIPSGQGGELSWQQKHYKELRDAIFVGYKEDTGRVNKKGEKVYSTRPVEDNEAWMQEIRNDEFLSQVYAKVRSNNSKGEMTAGDTKFIYPYEYWDETSVYNGVDKNSEEYKRLTERLGREPYPADINGARYLEYCRRLGYKPKFVGKLDGKPESDFGNFADDRGYWKLLIDRRMYDTRGYFQDLTPVSSEGFSTDLVDPEKTEDEFKVTRVADDAAAKKVADRVLDRESSRPGGIATVDYDLTLDDAVREYNAELEKKPEDYTPAQQSVMENYLGVLRKDFGGTTRSIFSFVGEKGAAELDKASNATIRIHNRDIAIAMEEIDADPLAIKMATGWERGADGAWRYESSDVIAPSEKINALKTGDSIRLGDLVNPGSGPLIAYPELADFTVKVVPKKESFYGQLKFNEKQIDLNLSRMSDDYFGDVAVKANSTLAHEVQHAIQNIEGFAHGANTSLAMDNPVLSDLKNSNPTLLRMIEIFGKIPARRLDNIGRVGIADAARGVNGDRTGWNNLDAAHKATAKQLADDLDNMTDADFARLTTKMGKTLTKARIEAKSMYRRSAGEVEARNVQRRQAMTPDQREMTLAESTEDVPRSEQIVNRSSKKQQDIRFSVSNERNEIFISNAQKAISDIKMEKATPEQWLKMIEKGGGLKAGEDKWIGLSDWLKSSDRKSLTKQEVSDFIEQNKIQIEEVHYGEEAEKEYDDALMSYQDEYAELVEEGKKMGRNVPSAYAMEEMVERYGERFLEAFERDGETIAPTRVWAGDDSLSSDAMYFLDLRKESATKGINPTRLDYTTEGLENKREIALTVPTIEPWNQYDNVHFGDAGEGRAIAWIRFGDATVSSAKNAAEAAYREADKAWRYYRNEIVNKYALQATGTKTTKDLATPEENARVHELRMESDRLYHEWRYGRHPKEKVLVIDEIQSKRHQEGREKGYQDPELEKRYDEANRAYDEFTRQMEEKYGLVNGRLPLDRILDEEKAHAKELRDNLREIGKEWNEYHTRGGEHYNAVPVAPFEKNWHELAMKRMLRLAAEEGYDYVAWTTGEQQAERYNIGGVLNSIERRDSYNLHEKEFTLNLNSRGTQYITTDDDGNITRTIVEDYRGKTLSDLVGKELALRMLSMKEGDSIQGDGLRVGGEGMKGFYDDILPRFMNKYGKKWGVKVEDLDIPDIGETGNGLTMHAVPVTPEMKESVMGGQPMFSIHGREVQYPESVTQEQRSEIEKSITRYSDTNSEGYKKAKAIVEEVDAMIEAEDSGKSEAIRREIEDLKKTASANNSLLGKLVKDPSKRDEFLSLKKKNAELNATIREKESSLKNIDYKSGDNKSRRDKAIRDAGVLDSETWRGIGTIPTGLKSVSDFFNELGWNGDSMVYATEFGFVSHWVAHHGELSDTEVSYDTLQNLYAPDLVGVEEAYPESLQFIRRTGANEWSRTTVMINRFKGDGSLMFGTTFKQNKNPRKKLARILDLGYPKGAAASDRLSSDFDNHAANIGINSESAIDSAENLREKGRETFSIVADPANIEEAQTRFSVVTDEAKIQELENDIAPEPAYRAAQFVPDPNGDWEFDLGDGRGMQKGFLYPPMSAQTEKGEWRNPIRREQWEQSDESPDKAILKKGKVGKNGKRAADKWVFRLHKGNGKYVDAAYNPYLHSSDTMLNDQFSEAQSRGNLVVLEVALTNGELDGNNPYHAEKAKDSVGRHDWKAGPIQAQLTGTRTVNLTRWDKPMRLVPVDEVADNVAKMIKGQVELMPSNVVWPQLREELEKRGVQFIETDNQGKILDGEHKGEYYSKVYKNKKKGNKTRFSTVGIAPNGKKSNLTDEQWRMVRTPAFKRWFGDWENDPENASKVVDENGEPRVVYHGTRWDPMSEEPGKAVFDVDRVGDNFDFVDIDWNFFFTASEASARGYGRAVPVFLNIRNMEVHTINERVSYEMDEEIGHDIVVNAHDAGSEYDEITRVENPDGVMYTIRAVDVNEAERRFGEAIKEWEGEHKQEIEDQYNALKTQEDELYKQIEDEYRRLYDELGFQTVLDSSYDDFKERAGYVLDQTILGAAEAREGVSIEKIEELQKQFNDVDQKMFHIFQRIGIEGRPEYEEYEQYEVPRDYRKTDMFALDNPNQIKSATNNNGDFSTENNDIRFSTVSDEQSEKLFEAAKERFGVTKNIKEAGYVLPDGTMLDFSGRHWTSGDTSWMNGMRQVDHRDISELEFEKDGNTPSGLEVDMPSFIRRGAIRIDSSGSINLATKPTAAQESVLRRLIESGKGYVWVDFGDGNTSDHSVSYDNIRPERIINDIRRYFNEGVKPESRSLFSIVNRDEAISRVEKEGLGGVIGEENVQPLMRSVYAAIPKSVKAPIVDKAVDGLDFRKSLNDYLHELAAKGTENDETGLLFAMYDEIRAISGNPELTDGDIRYMIWKSTGDNSDDIISLAEQQVNKRRWGVGESPRFSFKEEAEGTRAKADDTVSEADKARTEAMRKLANERSNRAKALARPFAEEFRETARIMGKQRVYDRATIDAIIRMTREVMKEGHVSELTRSEASRLMTLLSGANGSTPAKVAKNADQLFDLLLEHIVKGESERFNKLVNIKDTTVKDPGIPKVGRLDPLGQHTIKTFRANMMSDQKNIKDRLEDLSDRMDSKDESVKKRAQAEYDGLILARDYVEQVGQNQQDELNLLSDMDDTKAGYDAGNMTREEYRQYEKMARESLRNTRMQRIDLYRDFYVRLEETLDASKKRASEFRDAEKKRVDDIHHDANRDLEGVPTNTQTKQSGLQRMLNWKMVRFFAKPLATFDQMLRVIGRKSVTGEGFLWNRLVRQWETATENQQTGMYEATKELDAKASEVFGKKMIWADLYREERKLPGMDIEYYDGGKKQVHTLTQGNLLYIYMVDKMTDGRMKLRKMGITEEHVAAIKDHLDPRFIELADWIQESFLSEKRKKYNEVHERLFGASMDEIENYFPLKIDPRARIEEVDLGSNPYGNPLASTTTGAIIKRKKNSTALDLMHTDAFSLVIEHLEQMEDWAAYAEFRRDVNTLLSYKTFRNRLQNMTTIYGSGDAIWKNFEDVCKIVTGSFRPKVGKYDTDALFLNAAKGVTAAKISFRVNTAIKQLLSFPAYLPDANIVYLAKSMATAPASWNWCMENLPVFQKRWRSRIAGDTRLMDADVDSRFWKNEIVKIAARWGMTPNALVDATTVAVGAKAMYDTRYARYIKDGYSEEQADRKAKQDATILYNQTQQSSESAFVSAIQLDRTFFSVLLSTYRNSSMSYQRQLHDAVRTVGRMFKPGFREQSIEFMTKQRIAEGLDEDTARRGAEREFNRQYGRSMARIAVFGYGLQLLWKLGSNMWYLLFGDDDDKKEEMISQALLSELVAPLEGLTGGNIISDLSGTIVSGGSLKYVGLGELPIESDIENILSMMEYDKTAAYVETGNLLMQSLVGVNPQTFTDLYAAVVDKLDGDLDATKEFALLMMRIAQVPQSTIDEFMVDEVYAYASEAQKMSVEELAQRYADYRIRKGVPAPELYDEGDRAKREKSYKKKFKDKVKARNKLHEEKNNAE